MHQCRQVQGCITVIFRTKYWVWCDKKHFALYYITHAPNEGPHAVLILLLSKSQDKLLSVNCKSEGQYRLQIYKQSPHLMTVLDVRSGARIRAICCVGTENFLYHYETSFSYCEDILWWHYRKSYWIKCIGSLCSSLNFCKNHQANSSNDNVNVNVSFCMGVVTESTELWHPWGMLLPRLTLTGESRVAVVSAVLKQKPNCKFAPSVDSSQPWYVLTTWTDSQYTFLLYRLYDKLQSNTHSMLPHLQSWQCVLQKQKHVGVRCEDVCGRETVNYSFYSIKLYHLGQQFQSFSQCGCGFLSGCQ